METVGLPVVSGHFNLQGEIDDGFNIRTVNCPNIIIASDLVYHCDLDGPCDCQGCTLPPNSFCRMVEQTNPLIYGQVTGEHDLNYTLDIWNDLIRFSGMHEQFTEALISGHSGESCTYQPGMSCTADSDALIEVEQLFTMVQDDFVQVISSLMLSSMARGTRELDWWIMDAAGDEFTPGAVIAEHHLRMCDPVADDNIEESIFVQLPAGSYRFKARYASATNLAISRGDCSAAVPPLTDTAGPGLDSWVLTLTYGVCPADLNGNNEVNIDDLIALLGAYGPCPPSPNPCTADIAPPGGNGVVNIDDQIMLLGNFGTCQTSPPGGVYLEELLDNEDWYGAEAIGLTTVSVDNSIANTTKGVPSPRVNCFGLEGCKLGYAAGVGGKWYLVTGNGQQMTASLCGSPEVNPGGLTITLDALRIFTDDNPPGMNPVPINHNGSFWDCAAAYLGNECFPAPADPCETDTTFSWNTVAGQHYWIFIHGVFPLDGDFCTPTWPQTGVAGPFILTVTSP